MQNNNLNRNSSVEQKKDAIEAVADFISEVLFDKVNFVTLVFSQFTDSGGTTSTTNYATDSRIIDTSEGKFFNQNQPSRMACSFYTQNADELEGYILSPALLDSTSLGTVSNLSSLRGYVGLKIVNGDVSVVVKNDGQDETLYNTTIKIPSGFSSTYRLEIRYNLSSADVIFNGELLGTYELNWALNEKSTVTFYPLFSPGNNNNGVTSAGSFDIGKTYEILTVGTTSFTSIGADSNTVGERFAATGPGSGSGTATAVVNIVIENFQFIQSKN